MSTYLPNLRAPAAGDRFAAIINGERRGAVCLGGRWFLVPCAGGHHAVELSLDCLRHLNEQELESLGAAQKQAWIRDNYGLAAANALSQPPTKETP